MGPRSSRSISMDCCRCPKRSKRSPCACCTAICRRRTSGWSRGRCVAAGHDVTCVERRLTRVPRVRAHADDGRERVPAPAVPRLPVAAVATSLTRCSCSRRPAGSCRWPMRPRCPQRCCCRVRPVACSRQRLPRRRTGSPTPSRSTWVGRRPTCASCAARFRSRRRAVSSPDFPIRLPSLDVHTIGAGGGSIARIDPGGALAVGPESAGAMPGPACYGRGGDLPTVTDADLVLGRIPRGPSVSRARRARRRRGAGRRSRRAGVDAQGVVAVVNAAMEQAVRTVTVARGVDPRTCALVAFGGAGPLHACELADALGITSVIVPARAGVLSAVGLLGAPLQRELVRSWPTPSSVDGVDAALSSLAADVRAARRTRGRRPRHSSTSGMPGRATS